MSYKLNPRLIRQYPCLCQSKTFVSDVGHIPGWYSGGVRKHAASYTILGANCGTLWKDWGEGVGACGQKERVLEANSEDTYGVYGNTHLFLDCTDGNTFSARRKADSHGDNGNPCGLSNEIDRECCDGNQYINLSSGSSVVWGAYKFGGVSYPDTDEPSACRPWVLTLDPDGTSAELAYTFRDGMVVTYGPDGGTFDATTTTIFNITSDPGERMILPCRLCLTPHGGPGNCMDPEVEADANDAGQSAGCLKVTNCDDETDYISVGPLGPIANWSFINTHFGIDYGDAPCTVFGSINGTTPDTVSVIVYWTGSAYRIAGLCADSGGAVQAWFDTTSSATYDCTGPILSYSTTKPPCCTPPIPPVDTRCCPGDLVPGTLTLSFFVAGASSTVGGTYSVSYTSSGALVSYPGVFSVSAYWYADISLCGYTRVIWFCYFRGGGYNFHIAFAKFSGGTWIAGDYWDVTKLSCNPFHYKRTVPSFNEFGTCTVGAFGTTSTITMEVTE